MRRNVQRELARLPFLNVDQLRQRYARVFGTTTETRSKTRLLKRIAWRLQALAEGDLSQRARLRAAELANDADLRVTAAGATKQASIITTETDPRLPPPGTTISRKYKGRTLQVKVLAEGFSYDGTIYASLSAAAKAITGDHYNGFLFFRLSKKEERHE
jgi:hypothetical protein